MLEAMVSRRTGQTSSAVTQNAPFGEEPSTERNHVMIPITESTASQEARRLSELTTDSEKATKKKISGTKKSKKLKTIGVSGTAASAIAGVWTTSNNNRNASIVTAVAVLFAIFGLYYIHRTTKAKAEAIEAEPHQTEALDSHARRMESSNEGIQEAINNLVDQLGASSVKQVSDNAASPTIPSGELYITNGRYTRGTEWELPLRGETLSFQMDGNLVLYGGEGYDGQRPVIWATSTNDRGARELRMQGDGNLVIYNTRFRSF